MDKCDTFNDKPSMLYIAESKTFVWLLWIIYTLYILYKAKKKVCVWGNPTDPSPYPRLKLCYRFVAIFISFPLVKYPEIVDPSQISKYAPCSISMNGYQFAEDARAPVSDVLNWSLPVWSLVIKSTRLNGGGKT